MHICIGKLTIIGSDDGLSPGWRQAIIWTNAGILLTEPFVTNFRGFLIENSNIENTSENVICKMLPFRLSLITALDYYKQARWEMLHNIPWLA